MKARPALKRNVLEDLFHAHDPFTVFVQTERGRDSRARSIRAYQVTCSHFKGEAAAIKPDHAAVFFFCVLDELRVRHPFNSGADRTFEKPLIEHPHSSDTKLIVWTGEFNRPSRRRIKRHIPHRRTQTIFRK